VNLSIKQDSRTELPAAPAGSVPGELTYIPEMRSPYDDGTNKRQNTLALSSSIGPTSELGAGRTIVNPEAEQASENLHGTAPEPFRHPLTLLSSPSHRSDPARPVVEIYAPDVKVDGAYFRVTYPVTGLSISSLWFELPTEFASLVGQPSCDAALVGLLIPILAAASRCVVRGPVSPLLAWNLSETVIPVVRRLVTDVDNPSFTFEQFTSERPTRGTAVVSGFSNGVDSFTVAADYLIDTVVREQDRITHLLFNDVGSHGVGAAAPAIAAQRWVGVEATAHELGVPVVPITSNLDDFYSEVLNFQVTSTVRNAAVALLVQHGSKRFMYASSFPWNQISVTESEHMAIADPILLAGLCTERMHLSAVGTKYTRIEKTDRIASLDIVQRRLDVCVKSGTNCSQCWKCMRTQLTLELLGHLPNFSRVFDLEVYRKHRPAYIAAMWAEIEHLGTMEVRTLAIQRGVRPPLLTRILAFARRGTRRIYRFVRLSLLDSWRKLPEPTRRKMVPAIRALRSTLHT
jgi:hypothetical protein